MEKHDQLATFLLNFLLRKVDKNHIQNFRNYKTLSRIGHLAVNKIKKIFKYKNLLSTPFELLNLFEKLKLFRQCFKFFNDQRKEK